MVVTVNLMGGLSNNLFQMFAAISYSIKYNCDYCIPDKIQNPHSFNQKVFYSPYLKYGNVDELPGTKIVYNEPYFEYKAIPKFDCDILVLNGYFQSFLYWDCYLPAIKNLLNLDYSVKNKGVVAIHKRLGDYKLYKNIHPIISHEYIESALSFLYALGYRKGLVFSDEINEAELLISKENHPKWEFEYSYEQDEVKDFQKMINCESFILSASSYSLMASILSESENKICSAPRQWFGADLPHDTNTLLPENYIVL